MTITYIDNPRGYLFLDVDGVLNPFTHVRLVRPDLPAPDWELRRINGYRVWVGHPVSDWLNGLLSDGIQIVWATTWVTVEPALRELAENWNLPTDLPRIDGIDQSERYVNSGKRPGVERWLLEHEVDPAATPVVWLDDDLGAGDKRYAQARGITPVAIDPEVGLSAPRWRAVVEDALGARRSTEAA